MKHTGFTLIEMLVVVLIIGILTSIALPQYRKAIDRAKAAEALQMMPALYDACDRWVVENGYHWEGNIIKNGNTKVTPTLGQLDIETKGYSTVAGDLVTKNFLYYFGGYAMGASQCDTYAKNNGVVAYPKWGNDQRDHYNAVTLCYVGKVVCCLDHSMGACQRLNIPGCTKSGAAWDDD